MKHILRSLFAGMLALMFSAPAVRAQVTAAQAMSHPVIMQYYSAADLQYLEQNDTAKLAAIIYYFTASFIVEPVSCTDCVPFDSATFDISQYEQFRQYDQPYVRVYEKYGFKLTIIPVNQMAYTLPIHDRFLHPAENNTH